MLAVNRVHGQDRSVYVTGPWNVKAIYFAEGVMINKCIKSCGAVVISKTAKAQKSLHNYSLFPNRFTSLSTNENTALVKYG